MCLHLRYILILLNLLGAKLNIVKIGTMSVLTVKVFSDSFEFISGKIEKL